MRGGEIAAENDTLDRAELAYAMAGRRGDWGAAALAHRVMCGAASRLNRLAARGAVLFFYHVVLTVTASSWEYFVRLQISSQRTSCQRGSCEH